MLKETDPRRKVRYEVHKALNCFFTPEELEKLKEIKSRKNWRPSYEKAHVPLRPLPPVDSRAYLRLMNEILKEPDEG